jgi:uncharacterized LabA/DUF88 family protein
MHRIAVFVDGSNFFFLQRDGLNWWIDPQKMLNWVSEFGTISHATYFASFDSENLAQKSYHKALTHMGYTVKARELRRFPSRRSDIDIVVGMFEQLDDYDCCVLVSGNGDFVPALEAIKNRGKDFLILSTKNFVANWVAETKTFIDLQTVRLQIEKTNKNTAYG